MWVPCLEMRTALLYATFDRQELHARGRSPCAARSLFISACWVETLATGRGAATLTGAAAFGLVARARGLGLAAGLGAVGNRVSSPAATSICGAAASALLVASDVAAPKTHTLATTVLLKVT